MSSVEEINSKMSKLPLKGRVDIEFFDDKVVLTLIRADGKELSASMTVEELENLAIYLVLLLINSENIRKEIGKVLCKGESERYEGGGC